MTRRAGVYWRGSVLIVYPQSQTTEGIWLAQEPLEVVPSSATTLEKGMVLRKALASSSDGVPHPTSWGHQFDRFLEVADVKTWAAFVRKTKAVNVEQTSDGLVLTPERNGGARDGFIDIPEDAIKLATTSSTEELGGALEMALAAAL